MKRMTRPAAGGMSLIELMIAILIGSILVLGLVEVFAASRTAYQMSEGLARVQENSRFAMDYLQRDLRMGGHFGCVNDQSHLQTAGELHSHFADVDGPLQFNVSVQGYEANNTEPNSTSDLSAPKPDWIPGLPSYLKNLKPSPGSDVIVLRYLAGEGVPVSSFVAAPGTTTITVPAGSWGNLTSDGVAKPTLFGVADCNYADIFQATTIPATATLPGTLTVTTPSVLNKTDFTSDRYSASPAGQAMLYRAEAMAYYVAPSATPGQQALWRVRFGSDAAGATAIPEELVEGIESLQLLYGVDKETDPAKSPSGYIDTQATANNVAAANWQRVGMVRVGLLAKSPNPAAAQGPEAGKPEQRPSALGVSFIPPSPNDGSYRTTYESTIALRNRLYGN